MNIAKPPASVLTHGGDSDKAILHTIGGHTEHLDAQHETKMAATRGEAIERRHMHYDDVPEGYVTPPIVVALELVEGSGSSSISVPVPVEDIES